VFLTLMFHQEGRQWVGVCRELGTSSFDKDFQTAKSELLAMTRSHLEALHEVGELPRFLKEHRVPHASGNSPIDKRRVQLPSEEEPTTFTSSVRVPLPLDTPCYA